MRILISLLFILLTCTAGQAETVRKTVPANKTSSVGAQAVYSMGDCHGGPVPQMKVKRGPENGTVSFKKVAFKLSKSAGKCAGRRVGGTAIYYKPKRGFRGKDVFTVRYTMDAYTAGSAKIRNIVQKYIIDVK